MAAHTTIYRTKGRGAARRERENGCRERGSWRERGSEKRDARGRREKGGGEGAAGEAGEGSGEWLSREGRLEERRQEKEEI
jgi:hypothetical protein